MVDVSLPQSSPIMRFALEVFEHALESYVGKQPRHRKFAVLGLAQAVELAIKATLVEKNVSIYEKDGNRTLNPHGAMLSLAKLWGVERMPMQARIELLIDERNAIQHRYGSVDDVTMDYHMQTAFSALADILQREFDADLQGWVRSNVEESVWRRVRFVDQEAPEAKLPSDAIVDERSATLDFIDGFTRFEGAIRKAVAEVDDSAPALRSSLDLVMKFLANVQPVKQELIDAMPGVYRVRNQVIHGDREAKPEEVESLLHILDEAVHVLRDPGNRPVLVKAIRATGAGVRGTRLDATALAQPDVPFINDAPPGVAASGTS